jgi:hypothetical protein
MELSSSPLNSASAVLNEALLQHPEMYDRWHRDQLEILKVSRGSIVETLLSHESALAILRAAMLLTSTDPQQSGLLAERALRDGTGLVRIMAKAQLAILGTLAAWKNAESQRVAATPFLAVLEGLIAETKQMQSSEPFALEIEVRIHSILADGFLLAEKPDLARRHAAEAQLLAPVVGLRYLVSTSQYQLSRIYFFEADAVEAHKQLERVLENPATTKLLAGRAQFAKAHVAFALGDDNEALRCLDAFDADTLNAQLEKTDPFRKWTLRFAPQKSKNSDLFQIPPLAQYYDLAIERLLLAQQTRPDRLQEIEQHFERAQVAMDDLLRTSHGWEKHLQRIWSAYFSLQLGDYGSAHSRLPAISELESLPIYYRIFGFNVAIETLSHLLPISAGDLADMTRRVAIHWSTLEPYIVSQVAAKLSLLTPLALSITSRWRHSVEAVSIAGNLCVINLRHRPIQVYGNDGLRPVQAARFILEQFEWDTDFLGSDGGGQQKALQQALLRRFYERDCWFRPVSAAYLAYVLLSVRETLTNAIEQQHLLQGCRDLKRRYGFTPKLQKVDQINQLEQIERVLASVMSGEITSVSAGKLLFGRGS